jgi:hypothetical protein
MEPPGGRPPHDPHASKRRSRGFALIDRMHQLALTMGRSWADDVRVELERQGRRAVGMWPGTVSEARALATKLIQESFEGTETPELRERVAREVYAAARRGWGRWREPDEDEGAEGDEEETTASLTEALKE